MAVERKSLSERILDRFVAQLQTSGLIPAGAKVLLGYSGGADSTCLLHLLNASGIDVSAAHLHHGQRSEADQELLQCESICQGLGIAFLSGKADVPAIAKLRRIGLEEAGREARYEFLRMAAKQLGCDLVATAHTRNDHVETVLFNIIRGTGLAGISGIPQRRNNIVRPLLEFTREETRSYCIENEIWTHNDPANDDLSFSRVRIRKRILPELESINPSALEAIARLASTAGEEDRFLDAAAGAALETMEIPLNGTLRFLTLGCEAAFDRTQILHLPDVLLRRAIRLATEFLGATWDYSQTHAIAGALKSLSQGSFTTEGGRVVLEWSDNVIHVRELEEIEPFRFPLTLSGETEGEGLGWSLSTRYMDSIRSQTDREALEVQVDPEAIRGALYFRSPKSGDKMRPLGFQGQRKLSDLLSEAKLTRTARNRLPVVCDMIGPIWVPGVCVEDRVVMRGCESEPKCSKGQTPFELDIVEKPSGKALWLCFRALESKH